MQAKQQPGDDVGCILYYTNLCEHYGGMFAAVVNAKT